MAELLGWMKTCVPEVLYDTLENLGSVPLHEMSRSSSQTLSYF